MDKNFIKSSLIVLITIAMPLIVSPQMNISRLHSDATYAIFFSNQPIGTTLAATSTTIKSDTLTTVGTEKLVIRTQVHSSDLSNLTDTIIVRCIEVQPGISPIVSPTVDTIFVRKIFAATLNAAAEDTLSPFNIRLYSVFLSVELKSDALRDSASVYSVDAIRFLRK